MKRASPKRHLPPMFTRPELAFYVCAFSLLPCPWTAGVASAQSAQVRTTEIFVSTGSTAFDHFGVSVSPAGDVNGDGFDDLMAGSLAGGTGPGSPGYVRVLSGRNGIVLHELRGLTSQEHLFGCSMDAAGDVNSDGFDDLIVGSPNPDPTAPIFGSVYVFSGADGSILHRFVESEFNDDFGRAVAGVGDIDGDGDDDLLVGAPLAGNARGFARLYSGSTGEPIRTYYGVGGERLGAAVSALGDLNGDGTPDLLIGSPAGIPGSCPACVRAVSGLDGAPLLTLTNGDPMSQLGAAVAVAGDLNGDGVPDILAGAPDATIFQSQDGAVYLFSGADGTVLRRWTDREGSPLPSAFGAAVSGGGDIDGDGVDDIVVGAPAAKGAANGILRGAVYAYSGADGRRLFRVIGDADRDQLGSGTCIVGDANGDGYADVATGASFANSASQFSGNVRVLRRLAESGGALCIGEPNSTGSPSILELRSPSQFETATNDLSLEVTELPPNVLGFFLVSPDFNILNSVGGGMGTLCIASSNIGRYSSSISLSSPGGEVGFTIDNTAIPLPSGQVAVVPGDTFNFQFWHRDAGATTIPTSNLSGAATVTFH